MLEMGKKLGNLLTHMPSLCSPFPLRVPLFHAFQHVGHVHKFCCAFSLTHMLICSPMILLMGKKGAYLYEKDAAIFSCFFSRCSFTNNKFVIQRCCKKSLSIISKPKIILRFVFRSLTSLIFRCN